ncbi:MAG TPA: hypothetical protein VMF09_09780 [Solirubrobacteraceae bacterium]|nr:hypothetical protein [Solirubrobacteraceae bacterium]
MVDQGIEFVAPPSALAEESHTPKPENSLPEAWPALGQLDSGGVSTRSQFSGNWSGYYQWNGKGTFTQESAYFVEPSNKGDSCSHVASAIWGGLGGNYENAPLGQDGTEQGNSGVVEEHLGWFEVLPAGSETIEPGIHATTGSWFLAATEYTGFEEYSFYEYNFSTHKAARGIAFGKFDGNVADDILERLGEDGLVNVGSVAMQGFTNGKAFAGTGNKTARVVMQNESGEVNAQPSPVIKGYEFHNNYERCPGSSPKKGKAEQEGALPVATTIAATGVTETSSTLRAVVNPEGHETSYAFEYGTEAENYSSSTLEGEAGTGTTNVAVGSSVSGLSPGTTYHYRVIAFSTTGIAVGEDKTFETPGTPPPPPPTVTATKASAIGYRQATLEGTVNPNGAETHYYFEYGSNPGLYEAEVPAPPGENAGSRTKAEGVHETVTGLHPGTTYYYRLVAANSSGTSYSGEEKVTTPIEPPHVITESASAITGTHARVAGMVNPEGFPTTYDFEYWPTADPSEVRSAPDPAAIDGEAEEFNGVAVTLEGLKQYTQYTYLLSATNGGGTTAGERRTFKTRGWTPPEETVNPEGSPTSVKLLGVSCSASNACTAVGAYIDLATTYISLAERWNGTAWEVQSTPNPAEATGTVLTGVSCHGGSECTAVGYYEKTSDGPHYPVAERWNGSTWAIETMPSPSKEENVDLAAVSCGSSKQCVAVGQYNTGKPATRRALAEQWDGTAWKVKTTAKLPTEDEQSWFEGVSCADASQCAVVGVQLGTTLGEQALAERLDGTKWADEVIPAPEHSLELELKGVSCSASDACTAVGRYKNTDVASGEHCCEHHAEEALIERWNGTAWALQTAPSPLGKSEDENQEHWTLSEVSCGAATACSAVGQYAADSAGKEVILLGEYWNGSTWELEPPVNRSGVARNTLLGVSCPEAELCTAVGESLKTLPSGPSESLAEALEPAEP